MRAQDNKKVVTGGNQHVGTLASLLRNFKDESLTFSRSKVEKDPQEFIDYVYKILYALGFNTRKKSNLATDKLKDMAQTLYIQ